MKAAFYQAEFEIETAIHERKKLLLASNTDIISDKGIASLNERLKKLYKLEGVEGLDLNKIKVKKDGRAWIYLGRELASREGVNAEFCAKNKDALLDKLYYAFFESKRTLNDVFEKYTAWRIKVGTNHKTVREGIYEWNRFFRDSPLGKAGIETIEMKDVRDQFLIMTSGYAISKHRFISARAVLNGVLQYAIEEGYIKYNPVPDISMQHFKKRFKPEIPKDNLSYEDIVAIVNELKDSTDIYDIAIRFSFFACLRIGELKAIRYTDIKNGMLKVHSSITTVNPITIDEDNTVSFGKTRTVETVVKGASNKGVRSFPLSDEAIAIAKFAHELNPDDEYLFMNNGSHLTTVTFNRHLKKVCEKLGIDYISSHRIRFTNCDRLLNEAKVNMSSLQAYMGHTNSSMTEHYIREHLSHEDDNEKVRNCLSYA